MNRAYTAKEIAEALTVNRTTIVRRSERENWLYDEVTSRGGKQKCYFLSSLPADIQQAIVAKSDIPADAAPVLAPAAELALYNKINALPFSSVNLPTAGFVESLPSSLPPDGPGQGDDFQMRLGQHDLEKVGPWVRIIQEAQHVPPGWKTRAWIENVAQRHDTTFQTIYRKLNIYDKKGIHGLIHRKSTKGSAREWDNAALDFWVGLVLKRSHRKISKKYLYQCLQIEAHKRGWTIGSERSALWWLEKKVTPQLLALQRGGVRALDNTLPPILRDYSDLGPLEILVGDQHRFDFWVVDDETGEVFRPECYMWQDLRTRLIYGAAVDHKYDAMLIGLALRIGIRLFGAFRNIYTDNGKPELSRYVMGIMKEIRSLGMNVERETEYPLDVAGTEAEEIMPMVTIGQHRKAIVKNAKAKMIEGTFNVIEGILRNEFRLPGYVKDLHGPSDEQDIDQGELQRLAAAGKLPTFREFILNMYRALDWYNKEKPHRGVLGEWAWKPKPTVATPMQCLEHCYNDGWRPTRLSEDAVDLLFLASPPRDRIVDRGRISFDDRRYEADELVSLNGQHVDIRFDPIDPTWIHVYYRREFICRAEPVEYSSMKDLSLAERKIAEKYSKRKEFLNEYRKITKGVPSIREYSRIPAAEKAAALIGNTTRKKAEEKEELYRERTEDELTAETKALEEQSRAETQRRREKTLPKRPEYFLKEYDRYKWCVEYEMAGGELGDDDQTFKDDYEVTMDDGQREYWEAVKECGQI